MAAEQKPAAEVDDQTLIMADTARKAMGQMRETVIELLADRMERERAKQIAGIQADGTWTHDYPISVREAQATGLNISRRRPSERVCHPLNGEEAKNVLIH